MMITKWAGLKSKLYNLLSDDPAGPRISEMVHGQQFPLVAILTKNNAAQTLELTKAEFSSRCLLDAAGQSALIVSRNHARNHPLGSSNQRSGLPKVIVQCRMVNKGAFHPRWVKQSNIA